MSAEGRTARTGSASLEARRRVVAQSLQVGNPGNNSLGLPEEADPRIECQIELGVMEIRPYEHNPRRAGNSKFADIKESIRNSGLRTPLTVTRRPGEKNFIVESGGNTRLVALQQLWAETCESRFEKLSVLFRPWRSESHVLLAHMVENEQRGEMTFWDKANAIASLKAHLETERETALSLRELDAALKSLGLGTNHTSLGHYLFAVQYLRPLSEVIPGLSAQDVKTIQPRLNGLKRIGERAGVDSARFDSTVVEPAVHSVVVRHRQGHAFSARELCVVLEQLLAQHVGPSTKSISARSEDLSISSHPRVARQSGVNDVDINDTRQPLLCDVTTPCAGHGTPVAIRAPISALAYDLAQKASIDERFHKDSMAPLGFRVDGPIASHGLCMGARWIGWILWQLSCDRANDSAAVIDWTEGACAVREGAVPNLGTSTGFTNASALLEWLTDPQDDLAGAALEFLGELIRGRVDPRQIGRSREIRSGRGG